MLQDDGLQVQATATTHAAKHRLGPTAKTLHKLLGLRPGAMLSALTATNKIAQELDGMDVVVTDEFTMLTTLTLSLAAYRLRNCTKPGTPRKVRIQLPKGISPKGISLKLYWCVVVVASQNSDVVLIMSSIPYYLYRLGLSSLHFAYHYGPL